VIVTAIPRWHCRDAALGTSFTMAIGGITPGSVLGFMVLGLTPIPGGFDLTALGSPECSLYTGLDAVFSVPLAGSPTPYSVLLPSAGSLAGTVINAQAATLTPAATPLGILTSNALGLTLGL
jgi:hypothetical protein